MVIIRYTVASNDIAHRVISGVMYLTDQSGMIKT